MNIKLTQVPNVAPTALSVPKKKTENIPEHGNMNPNSIFPESGNMKPDSIFPESGNMKSKSIFPESGKYLKTKSGGVMLGDIIIGIIAFFAGGAVMAFALSNKIREIEKLNKKARAYEEQKRKELIDAVSIRQKEEERLDAISKSYSEIVAKSNRLKAASLAMRSEIEEVFKIRKDRMQKPTHECAALLNREEYERLIKGLS